MQAERHPLRNGLWNTLPPFQHFARALELRRVHVYPCTDTHAHLCPRWPCGRCCCCMPLSQDGSFVGPARLPPPTDPAPPSRSPSTSSGNAVSQCLSLATLRFIWTHRFTPSHSMGRTHHSDSFATLQSDSFAMLHSDSFDAPIRRTSITPNHSLRHFNVSARHGGAWGHRAPWRRAGV
jgi:hypothetical protein